MISMASDIYKNKESAIMFYGTKSGKTKAVIGAAINSWTRIKRKVIF